MAQIVSMGRKISMVNGMLFIVESLLAYIALSTLFLPSSPLKLTLCSLECQLNTVGVRGALHQSVEGISAALAKFAAAAGRGEATIAEVPPYSDVFM
jgi:hypothetical protein